MKCCDCLHREAAYRALYPGGRFFNYCEMCADFDWQRGRNAVCLYRIVDADHLELVAWGDQPIEAEV